jgi:hypothetical protein
MVEIQHACIKVLEEISKQNAVKKYQSTIGLKFKTHQSKHLRRARVVT